MKNIRIFSLVIAIIFMVVSIAADIAFYFTHKPDDILADEIAVSNGNRILQEKGFALQAWFPAEESDEKQISFENLEQFGFGPTYYHGNLLMRRSIKRQFTYLEHGESPKQRQCPGYCAKRPGMDE